MCCVFEQERRENQPSGVVKSKEREVVCYYSSWWVFLFMGENGCVLVAVGLLTALLKKILAPIKYRGEKFTASEKDHPHHVY